MATAKEVGDAFKGLVVLGVVGFLVVQCNRASAQHDALAKVAETSAPTTTETGSSGLSPVPTGALGLSWGSTPTAAMKKFGDTTSDGLDLYTPKVNPAAFEGVPVDSVDYQYDHKKLYGVDVYLKGEGNRAAITDALIRRYGAPSFVNADLHIYRWDWKPAKVQLMDYFDKGHDTATVSFHQGD